MGKIYFIGDPHMRLRAPYFQSKKMFWDWLVNQDEVNNEENYLVVLGDLADKPQLPGKLNYFINELIMKRLKFKCIYLLTGNHDSRRKEGNYLDGLKIMPNVVVLDYPQEFDIEDVSVLALPHYVVRKDHEIPMRKFYSQLAENPDFENNNDVVIGHFPISGDTGWEDCGPDENDPRYEYREIDI